MKKKILSSLLTSLVILIVGFFSGYQVLSGEVMEYLFESTSISSVSGDDLSKYYNVKLDQFEICGAYGQYASDDDSNYVCVGRIGDVIKYKDVNGDIQYIGVVCSGSDNLEEVLNDDSKLFGYRGKLSQMPDSETFAFQNYFSLFEQGPGNIKCFHISYQPFNETGLASQLFFGFGIMAVAVIAVAIELITCFYKCKKESRAK